MRPPARIPRSTGLHRAKQRDRVRRNHLAWVRSLGMCIACGKLGEMQAIHVRNGTDGGMGLKPSDRFVLPACAACHHKQHQIGELTFWSDLGVDPLDYCARLWAVTGDTPQGVRTIQRARQAIEQRRSRA